MNTLLLIDDDAEVLEVNKKYLTGEGFSVHITSKPAEGIKLVSKVKPDCILLDVMMPEMDGYQVCTEIRKFSDCPIIFLTGKGSEDDKINGLITGADDYIVKPYSLRELKARIDVILRRFKTVTAPASGSVLTFGDLKIDKLEHKAFYKNENLELTNREYDLLVYFAENPNREITFEELGQTLFGSYMESDRRSVMVNVSRLRKKMDLDFALENMIETVWSKGYKFIAK